MRKGLLRPTFQTPGLMTTERARGDIAMFHDKSFEVASWPSGYFLISLGWMTASKKCFPSLAIVQGLLTALRPFSKLSSIDVARIS